MTGLNLNTKLFAKMKVKYELHQTFR
jgi:hypothetical protein